MRKSPLIPAASVCWGSLCFVVLSGGAASAVVGDEAAVHVAEVHLANGQVLTALVDVRTDEQRLWLRFEGLTAALYRPVAWPKIDEIYYDGARYSAAAFQEVAESVASQRTAIPAKPIASGEDEIGAETPSESSAYADLAPLAFAATPRATSIAIDAFVASWDADVEVDGLVLGVTVLDRFGAAIPVRGALNVELIANRRAHRLPQLPSRRPVFDRLAQWNRPFRSLGGAQTFVRLPFQAVHPEFDATVPNLALVHVRLAVPGSGVLEASMADVRVRPYSQVRDQIQPGYGSRFYPTEGTGRARSFLPR